jgi:tRNA (cytidine/uridine-2'-O-)-methyltransferase
MLLVRLVKGLLLVTALFLFAVAGSKTITVRGDIAGFMNGRTIGFDITDKNLKRAGLDYWQHLPWKHHQTFADWQNQLEKPERVFYFSTKGKQYYYEVDFEPGDVFVFGKETKGLDEDLLRRNEKQVLKIPLLGPIRSLNVATAVTIVLYEAIRQIESRGRLKLP